MISSFVITFREVLEAALVIGIVLSYLAKTKQTHYNPAVYMGVVYGVAASILGAFLFTWLLGGFTGSAEQVFEGMTMLIGALLLTTMILWMMKQKQIAVELEHRVAAELDKAHKWGLLLLVFFAVLREGIETVIFLKAASFSSPGNTLVGASAGIIAAIFLGYTIFFGSTKINLKKFFNITSFLLILFAAGLVAHGIHELQEAGVIPTLIEHVWDINPSVKPGGAYPLMHEKGYVGSFLKSMFGYNGNPSLIEVMSYLVYLLLVLGIWKNTSRFKSTPHPVRT